MDGWITIGTKIDNKSFDAQIKELEDKLEGLEAEFQLALKEDDFPEEELKKYQVEIEKTKNKIVGLKKQQVGLNQEISNTGAGYDKTFKKVGKLALGIFSIRSAYMLVRQATNLIAQDNEDIANKLSAIKGSLTNLLAPAVEYIVNLVYRLLSYLNVITTKFLGIDLFKKTAKSGKSAVNSAQKLRKTLAGFDEMNILNDNVASSGGGGGTTSGGVSPVDTSGFQKTIENYEKMWNEILDIDRKDAKEILLNSDDTWGLLKLGWFDTTQGIIKQMTYFYQFLDTTFKGIKALVYGDTTEAKKQFGFSFNSIIGMFRGFAQTFSGINETIVGWGYATGKNFTKGIQENLINPLKEKLGVLWKPMSTNFISASNTITKYLTTFGTKIGGAFNKITTLFTNFGTKVGEGFSGAFKKVFNAMMSSAETMLNKPIRGINALVDKVNSIPGVKMSKLSSIKLPRLAQGGIVNNPGRGVNMGSYIAGERGAEAVLPLTDDTLQRLANMIPITINLTNSMNGRVISRELKKIQNQSNFANNWR